uniref:Uncharacterized protein n=1 Tax=Heterosigma akashiwo TaxID=2829 RepID=A0A7S3Y8G9_HETAK
MGAGASAAGEAAQHVAEELQEEQQRIVEGGAEAAQQAADTANAALEQVPDVGPEQAAAVAAGATTLVASVSEDARESVGNMIEAVKDKLSPEQLSRAISEMQQSLPSLDGGAVLVSCAASLEAASEMLPEVCAVVGATILAAGEHLPYLGVACGAIGTIMYTFRLSKDQDENVKTVQLWSASVKDWLLLVADKVERSKAESTLPLFQGLQEALTKISEQMYQRNRKWRISKMLTSTSFQRDFGRAKESVLELKNALRDFLDQEQQDRQEAYLQQVQAAQVTTNEKLDSLEEQLGRLGALLEAQAAEKAAAEADPAQVKEAEERLFENLQRAAGAAADADVPFARFVAAFEAFFYEGDDMPPEQKRGLRVGLDRDRTKMVSKPSWLKFYRQWTGSGLEVGAFLVRVAEENPDLFTLAAARGQALAAGARGRAAEALADPQVQEALSKGKERAGALAGKAGALAGKAGGKLFGKKGKEG